MALRAIVSKLRGPSAARGASLAFSKTCEHCGKPSSRIAGSLGQKGGAIKDYLSLELERYRRKHYMIRAGCCVVFFTFAWVTLSGGNGYLDDVENHSRKE